MKVSAQVKKPVGEVKDKDGKVTKPGAIAAPVEVEYAIGNTLPELAKQFGDEVVANAAKGAIIIALQAFVRRHIEKGTAPAEIQKEVTAWKPDVRTVNKQSAFEKASGALDKLTPEERKALLAKLQATK